MSKLSTGNITGIARRLGVVVEEQEKLNSQLTSLLIMLLVEPISRNDRMACQKINQQIIFLNKQFDAEVKLLRNEIRRGM